jgi:transcriptional repressor NrdR
MNCPFCGHLEDKVVDSREPGGRAIRSPPPVRAWPGAAFTTHERIDEVPYMVIKSAGEKFDRQKVQRLFGHARRDP